MNLMTLKGLESIAEKEFEAEADKWVRAITDRESHIAYEMLRPHFAGIIHWSTLVAITFCVSDHVPLRLCSDWFDYKDDSKMARLEDGKLCGRYKWQVLIANCHGKKLWHDAPDLKHALLLARWEHEGDERATWWA